MSSKQQAKGPAKSAPKKESGTGCFTILFAFVVVLVAAGWASSPHFPQHVLFTYDHLLGRFGFQEAGFHCRNNRYNHETDFSKMTAAALPGMASSPPVIEWKDYTPEKLKEVSLNYRLPVVIKGMFTDSVAGKEWTMEYFDNLYGNQTIIYHELQYPIEGITSSFQRQHLPTSLHNYIENVTAGGHRVLGNDHYLMLDHPVLIEQLELNRWKTFDGMPILPLSLRFFMGGNNTGVGWHAATSHNLFVEVKGKKLFKWMPPQSTGIGDLYPTLSNKLPAIEHCPGHYYNPNLKTWEYVLDNGDAAFTPAWVWHATRHLEPTIAVGLRMESFLHDLRSAPMLTFLAEFSTDIPGIPFFNAFTRGILQTFGIRLQGQPLSQHEKENGYKWDWLRDYMQAGGKLASEDQKDSQWKL